MNLLFRFLLHAGGERLAGHGVGRQRFAPESEHLAGHLHRESLFREAAAAGVLQDLAPKK
ncbi:hypothetical protein D3C83_92360 [compost metagenome]